LIKQRTLASIIETSGTGLHTAVPVHVRLLPAPPDTGYIFIRTDLGGFELPASIEYVVNCAYATTLMRTGVMLSTVEHLLAALRGACVDNVYIEIDNLEVPIMDGSSEVFTDLIERAGTIEQDESRHALRVRREVVFEQGSRRISLAPCDGYEIECVIDFPHPLIGTQTATFDASDRVLARNFASEISAARTFGFVAEIEALRKANLVRGGSLDNAIVLTPDGMLNPGGLRWADEFVRHKILDIIGDLALVGMPLLARVKAFRSGHALHTGVLAKLLRDDAAWEIVCMPDTRNSTREPNAPALAKDSETLSLAHNL
jgi:UDP-3-O-[3-hydroxymyristoyl] N-acetylglucosamine deacetylase